MTTRRPALYLASLLLLLATACNGPSDPPGEISIDLSPSSATVAPLAELELTVTLTGTNNTALAWDTTGGQITGSGTTARYTAPEREGTYTVTATALADTSKSASATVVVEADADVVTLVAPVAPLPGSDPADMKLVSPLAESPVPSGFDVQVQSGGSFVVPRSRLSVVSAIDVRREFGWTAVSPVWFSDLETQALSDEASASVASQDDIGPLSTAVQAIFTLPGFYHTDLAVAEETVDTLKALPEVVAFANELENHAADPSVLDVPAVEQAYHAAIQAASSALDTSAVDGLSAESSEDLLDMANIGTALVQLDWDATFLQIRGDEVIPLWSNDFDYLQRAVTWIGYIYEVDATAYSSAFDLFQPWDDDPWRADISLVSTAPVGAIRLAPDTIYGYLDVIGLAADTVAGFIPGTGAPDLDFTIPSRDAVYAVHLYTCAWGVEGFVHSENRRRDLDLLLAWPGGMEGYMAACAVNILEMAMDGASLLIEIPDLAEAVAVGAVQGTLQELVRSELEQQSDVFNISTTAFLRMQMTVLRAIYDEVAKSVVKQGLKGLLRWKAGQLAKAFDVPGAAANTGKVLTRRVMMDLITPWEGSAIWVGNPWPQPLQVVDFRADPNPAETGEATTFTWQILDDSGEQLSCTLDPGDGSRSEVISECDGDTTHAHTYRRAGTYSATLTVSGSEDSATADVDVIVEGDDLNSPPIIHSFSASPSPATANERVVFEWNITDPDDDDLICTINPDDGSISLTIPNCHVVSSREHTYLEAGTYEPRLTVGDGRGGSDAKQIVVHVVPAVPAPEPQSAATIAAGKWHSVALRNDGTVWAWGLNQGGLVGDGTDISPYTPVQVQDLSGVLSIAAGTWHSLALRDDGTVWAWGSNSAGQLGDGTTTNRHTPVQVQDLSGVLSVVSGGNHSLALRDDGTVWAWGDNLRGQLGDGTTTNRHSPVLVADLSDVVGVAAGSGHSLALRDDGPVWAWGWNQYGQLGDGTNTDRHTPVQVRNLSGVANIMGGGWHSLALQDDGTVWAWGDNIVGQLGDGTTIDRRTPVQSDIYGVRVP